MSKVKSLFQKEKDLIRKLQVKYNKNEIEVHKCIKNTFTKLNTTYNNIFSVLKAIMTKSLLTDKLDLNKIGFCDSLSKSDFDILIKNKNIDGEALFDCSIRRGLLTTVKTLLKDGKINPSVNNDKALIVASEKGYLKIVEFLLKDKRTGSSDENSFYRAYLKTEGNYPNIAKKLLSDVRFGTLDTAVSEALNEDYVELARQLILEEHAYGDYEKAEKLAKEYDPDLFEELQDEEFDYRKYGINKFKPRKTFVGKQQQKEEPRPFSRDIYGFGY